MDIPMTITITLIPTIIPMTITTTAIPTTMGTGGLPWPPIKR
jgi:hypothetical protein